MSKENQVVVRVATMDVGAEAEDAALEASVVPAGEAPASVDGERSERQHSVNSAGASLTVSSTITQILHVCSEHKKQRKLIQFMDKLREDERQQGVRQRALVIIFCNQIKTLRSVEAFLRKQRHQCAALHSAIPQARRESSLSEFKAGRLLVLVATDVAARGLHIKNLKYVINYDFPSNLEQYCHRIGRTGRNGEAGTAFSFFTRNLAPLAKDLVSLLQRSGAQVDPNLRELADVEPVSKSGAGSATLSAGVDEDEEDDEAEDALGEGSSSPEDVAAAPGEDSAEDSEGLGSAAGGLGAGGGLLIRPRKRPRGSAEDVDSDSSEIAETEQPEAAVAANTLPTPAKQSAVENARRKGSKAKAKRSRGKRGGKKHTR